MQSAETMYQTARKITDQGELPPLGPGHPPPPKENELYRDFLVILSVRIMEGGLKGGDEPAPEER